MAGSSHYEIDYSDLEHLQAWMEAYGKGAAKVVEDTLRECAPKVRDRINLLMPVSGRRFKGHTSGARGTKWERISSEEPLSVTVAANSKRRYLYFPDDGSNTKRHAGNQHFFRRGAEAALPQVVEALAEALAVDFGNKK